MTFELPRAVIFDWDNTLVDSWGAIMFAMNKTFAHFGMPEWSLDEIRKRCRLSGRDTFPGWFGADNWKKAYDLFYEHFNATRTAGGPGIRPGATGLLDWLKRHDIPCFVVSNKRAAYLREESTALNWDKYFGKLVGSGDAPNDKPARDPVDMALATIGIPAGRHVWFVGDTDVDMLCARNSGCTEVFVGDKAEAEELSIKLAFEDCVALREWLEVRS